LPRPETAAAVELPSSLDAGDPRSCQPIASNTLNVGHTGENLDEEPAARTQIGYDVCFGDFWGMF